jgi:hypothetical protein
MEISMPRFFSMPRFYFNLASKDTIDISLYSGWDGLRPQSRSPQAG